MSQQIPRDPPVYKLKDYDQEELSGTFYNEELQKVIKEDDVYEVEKILKSRGKGKNRGGACQMVRVPCKIQFLDSGIRSKGYLKTCLNYFLYHFHDE